MTDQDFLGVIKPLRCKIGFHQWFVDSAMYSHAECCNFCGTYRDADDKRRLDEERAMWDERYGK